jgi:hypothetical protein
MHRPQTSVLVLGLDTPPAWPVADQFVVADPLLVGLPDESLG